MTVDFGFLILFGCVVLQCQGQIKPPPCGKRLIFVPGSTARIEWTFRINKGVVPRFRYWYFTSSDGTLQEDLAEIDGDNGPKMKNSLLAGVTVEKPATLILKNVNQSYDGMYKFILTAGDDSGVSEVTVIIAVQATITISCSSITTVNKGDDIICLCKGEGGKPPANVTWYDKDGQIGETGNENQTLILRNVNGTYNGTYTCKAQSHTLTAEKSIEVRVRPDIKPTITSFTTNPSKAMVGQPVTIICVAIGRPEPSYTIIHNGTRIVSTVNIYAISRAEWNDTGTYTCNATNALGNDLEFLNLTVGQLSTTFSTTKARDRTVGTHTNGHKKKRGLGVFAIVGIVVGVLALVVIIIGVIYWFIRCKEKNHEEEGNADAPLKKRRADANVYDAVATGGDDGEASTSTAPHEYATLEQVRSPHCADTQDL